MTNEEILSKVCTSIDILIKAGEKYEGLFPSLLDLNTHEMLKECPEPIRGQRSGDRSFPGNNLIHDEPTLMTMYGLSKALGREDYTAGADKYLRRFATHCTHTLTGLFPWGEHAFWDLVKDDVNDGALHDHLRQAPFWMLEKLYEFDPGCIERFGEGLAYHWQEFDKMEYIRHAFVSSKEPYGWWSRACDFPRHGGFYLQDWTYAYLKTKREDFYCYLNRMLNYWWKYRLPNGELYMETRAPADRPFLHNVLVPGQTISLATTMLETAQYINDTLPELAATMRERAAVYIDGFFAAPHDIKNRVFVIGYKPNTDVGYNSMPIWGSVYGIWAASYMGLTCLCAYRLTGQQRLFDWSESVGKGYLEEPFPSDLAVPAMDSGLALGLLADLYDITGDEKWLDGGLELAEKLMPIYLDGDLPRGAAGIDWYESQMGPSFLLHGLARIALLARDKDNCALAADYTAR